MRRRMVNRVSTHALLLHYSILGATVMPHNLYLHSSICKDRQINDDELVDLVTGATADDEDSETDEQWVAEHVAKGKRGTLDVGSVSSETLHHAAVEDHHDTAELLSPSDRSVSIDDREPDAPSPPPTVYSRAVTWTLRLAAVDTIIALFIAFLINAFILIVGAAAFWEKQDGSTPGNDGEGRAHEHITGLDDAYMSLHDYVGPAAATLFAVALLASGQSSTLTGMLFSLLLCMVGATLKQATTRSPHHDRHDRGSDRDEWLFETLAATRCSPTSDTQYCHYSCHHYDFGGW